MTSVEKSLFPFSSSEKTVTFYVRVVAGTLKTSGPWSQIFWSCGAHYPEQTTDDKANYAFLRWPGLVQFASLHARLKHICRVMTHFWLFFPGLNLQTCWRWWRCLGIEVGHHHPLQTLNQACLQVPGAAVCDWGRQWSIEQWLGVDKAPVADALNRQGTCCRALNRQNTCDINRTDRVCVTDALNKQGT